MANYFEIGQTVELPSSGPWMTVTGIDGDRVHCTWISDDGRRQDSTFPGAALRLVDGGRSPVIQPPVHDDPFE